MNFALITKKLRELIDNDRLTLRYQKAFDPSDSIEKLKLFNLLSYRFYLQELKSLELNIPEIDIVNSFSIFLENYNELYLDSATASEFIYTANIVKTKVEGILRFLESNFGNESENIIRVKLPPVDDFEEMEKNMNGFKRAISVPLRIPGVDGDIKIVTAESGSIWFVILVGGGIALSFIAEIWWSAYVIRKKKLEGDMVQQQIRDYELSNNVKEELGLAQVNLIHAMVEAETKSLINRMNLPGDQDTTEKIKMAIITLDELIKKGAEIRPGLNMPENVSNLFPSKENIPLIESRIKQITDGNAQ